MREPIGKTISSIHRHKQVYINRNLIAGNCPIGPGQIYVYLAIASNEGLYQKKIVEELMLEKATVAKAVKKLVNLDYARVKNDKDDKRCTRVFLTERGRRMLPAIKSFFDNANSILLRNFSDEEIKMVYNLIERMNRNLIWQLSGSQELLE